VFSLSRSPFGELTGSHSSKGRRPSSRYEFARSFSYRTGARELTYPSIYLYDKLVDWITFDLRESQ